MIRIFLQTMASYRRNRNYSKQFAWTHELNVDLCKCYRKAKEDPSIGYINRLKNYWDEIYPQFSYLSFKRLRDQASRVEQRKIAMTTQNIKINAVNAVANNEMQNTNETDIKHIIEQEQTVELPDESANAPIKELLITILKRNYDNYIHKDLSDQTVDTTTNKKIKNSLLDAANNVMRDHLNRIENVTLWEINCTIYSIAISCKELNNGVSTTEKRKNEPPKWITSIENNINRIRKLIARIQVVIKCK